MEIVHVSTPSKSYDVMIGSHLLDALVSFFQKQASLPSSIFILTDDHVAPHYLENSKEALAALGVPIFDHIVPHGDHGKSFDNYYRAITYALESGVDRKSFIVALGGGMIGDLAGFVAGTFMRGISFVQLPTTLLAHDSAVGGKTGINHPLGKNMIGVFHQPEAVFYDTSTLVTLPHEQWRSGFAEVIKHALIQDSAFYTWLQAHVTSLTHVTDEDVVHMLKKGIAIKANVVSKDEKESGLRAILNFGHTLGHAIESEAGYGVVSHGDAVAIGMRFALELSRDLGSETLPVDEITAWMKRLGYPSIPDGMRAEALLEKMKRDKKSTAGKVTMVLLRNIGDTYLRELDDFLLLNALQQFIQRDKEQFA
ncbi:3-dehydroquinate synthase [Fictibacillus macauensis ZFHKF-1]|uniref:3-dehydroquinate synthase n=1 Tax=Fictibacillus macauensis ZFHKF-1 TaxID=1196324 RepID=I8AM85_9BACL|nr:3-dehydroquinate synthase [Fictibacillus macauensis]EIT86784.1 3-dehydroquinate synthase [Fictibacillus macauensis ZFHKF-1]